MSSALARYDAPTPPYPHPAGNALSLVNSSISQTSSSPPLIFNLICLPSSFLGNQGSPRPPVSTKPASPSPCWSTLLPSTTRRALCGVWCPPPLDCEYIRLINCCESDLSVVVCMVISKYRVNRRWLEQEYLQYMCFHLAIAKKLLTFALPYLLQLPNAVSIPLAAWLTEAKL